MSSQKSVFITGCTPGGIGFALAKEYHANGLRVIVSARRAEVLGELAQLGMETVQLDVTDSASIRAAHEKLSGLLSGKLDILVNNAGKSYTTPALDVAEEGIRSLFNTNVFSVMLLCQQFAPLLIATKGKIVNIGSIAALLPLPFGAVYNSSKAALHAYGNTLRVELAPFGVQVITIVTGGVTSNISTHNKDIAPTSLYFPMLDLFLAKRKGMSQKGAQPTDEYAKYVVRRTLKPRPSFWIWSGRFSFLAWIMDWMLPRWALDKIMARQFGLDVFKKRLGASKSKNA